MLHDAWLRWHAQNVDALDDPDAWLVTVTSRIALDRLRRAKTERSHYCGAMAAGADGRRCRST